MKKLISVFIVSPGDLAGERRAFKKAIDQLNIGFGDGANVEFLPLAWEDTLASTGQRSQGVINKDIDKCDVFILAMHRRWGQEAPDAKPYTSYTEEEFHRAHERWKKEGSPEIFVFFKRVDTASEADPGPQLQKVMDFRKNLEDTRKILFRYFDNEEGFTGEVDKHLRAYVKGELPKAESRDSLVIFPMAALKEVEEARAEAEQKANEAEQAHDKAEEARQKLEAMQMQTAEDAAAFALEGKIEYARQKFSELVTETLNLRIIFLAFEFFYRTGDLETALETLKKWLRISGPDRKSLDTASAYGNLGLVYQTRGELDRAEEMHSKSLSLHEFLDSKEGKARNYGNLGVVYRMRGKLDHAEKMFGKALALNESLDSKEGMANNYGNLGLVYKTRGELEQAEEMHGKALAVHESLGHKEGMAKQYGNLGVVYQKRGELDRAEEMHGKSLALNEAVGSKEGMVSNYGNLGVVYQTRGELDHAEKMFGKALVVHESLGHKEGMANDYCNLGLVYQTRGELDRAEKMFCKSLAIEKSLDRKEGMACDYGNLGFVYKACGELDHAEEMWKKSMRLFDELGSPNAEIVQDWLNDLF